MQPFVCLVIDPQSADPSIVVEEHELDADPADEVLDLRSHKIEEFQGGVCG
jgi:hypothetical protein